MTQRHFVFSSVSFVFCHLENFEDSKCTKFRKQFSLNDIISKLPQSEYCFFLNSLCLR